MKTSDGNGRLKMKKLNLKRQYVLFKLMSDLLNAGYNLKQVIQFIKEMDNCVKEYDYIENQLLSGKSFSDSVDGLINAEFVNQIMISERYGNLAKCLSELSKFIQRRIQNESKIKEVLCYPIVLIMMLIFTVFAINELVLPQLNNVSTINQYDFSMLYVFVGIVIITLLGLAYFYNKLSILEKRNYICRIPFIGRIYQSYIAYVLSMELSMLLSSGMELIQVVRILKTFKKNTLLNVLGIELSKCAKVGEEVTKLINKYRFLPSEYNSFFTSGKTINDIQDELIIFSKIKFSDMNKQVNRLINMIQPILFLIIGVCIIVAYLLVLAPIYSSLKGI